jgi:outer membrane receptor for ferrienterochelin and colicins
MRKVVVAAILGMSAGAGAAVQAAPGNQADVPGSPEGTTHHAAEDHRASPVQTGSAEVDSEAHDQSAELAPPATATAAPGGYSAESLNALSLEELLHIDVKVYSAAATSQSVTEAPSIITVISRADMETFGYRTVGEALASVPGVYVVDDLVTANVAVRGVSGGPDSWSRIVKFMIDGRPATYYNTGGALVGPEFIPIDAVDSIEVIRGPGSAIYGANAFLGVVNVITRRPTAGTAVTVAGEGAAIRNHLGSTESVTASLGLEGGKGFVFMAAEAGRLDRSGLTVPMSSPAYAAYGSRASENDISRPRSVFLKTAWNSGAIGTFDASYLLQRLDAHAQWTALGVLSPTTRLVQQNEILNLSHTLEFPAEKLTLVTHFSTTTGRSLPQEVLDADNTLVNFRRDRRNTAYLAGTEMKYSHQHYSALLGVEYLMDRDAGDTVHAIAKQPTARVNVGDTVLQAQGQSLTVNDVAFYAQGQAMLFQRLGLTAGMRYDGNDRWGNAINGRAAATYRMLEGLHLKLLYGSSYVPPSPTQLQAVSIRAYGGIMGNPELKSQKAHTAETALLFSIPRYLNLSLAAFVLLVNDRIENVQQGLATWAINLNSSKTYGSELTLDAHWQRYFARADLSLQRTTVQEPDPAPAWFSIAYGENGPGGTASPAYPEWMGHTYLGANFPEAYLQATVGAQWVGPRKSSLANIRQNNAAYLLDPYGLLGVNLRTVNVKLFGERRTQLGLHVTNLLDHAYSEGGALGADIPSLGRAVYLKAAQDL